MTDNLDEHGQKTLTVSWSRILEFQKCQQRTYLHMQGKGDTIKDGRRFIHGTLADRAMRMWLEQPGEHLSGQMESYVDKIWDEYTVDSDEYKIQWKGNVKEDQDKVRNLAKRVVRNVEPFLYKRVLPYDYQPEFRFREPMRIPDSAGHARTIILIGGMDIAVEEPDRISLYDLKATTNEKYVQGSIMPQLIFYAIAWNLMFGKNKPIRAAFLTPACEIQYHELTITEESKRQLMGRVVKYAHSVWDQQEPLCTEDKNECFFCDVKGHCPKFMVPTKTVNGKHTASFKDALALRQSVRTAKDEQ